jgi:3D (Asp-Asp-Asp) domain-containing protein
LIDLKIRTPLTPAGRTLALPLVARTMAGAAVIAVVMGSAVMTKRTGTLPALVGIDRTAAALPAERGLPASGVETETPAIAQEAPVADGIEILGEEIVTENSPEWDLSTRWFDGRPVRPARVLLMRVTAYSPDHRSCGEFADGQTATLHSVWTNGMRLVAADPKVLPYGTMLTVPGYADDEIVPVLDCGGAIRGARLDLLYPTHERARQWGVQDLRVVIWEYADGQPAPNPRKVR